MKITTIILSFNHSNFIAKAIDSVIEQSGNFKHEILISDDGSKDNTLEIILKYAEKYPLSIRNISKKKNSGTSGNYKHCFKEATGDYIAILEGDDYWVDPQKINRQMEFLNKYNEASMVFSRCLLLDFNTGRTRELKRQNNLPQILTADFFVKNKHLNLIVNLSTVMLRKTILKNIPNEVFDPHFSEISLVFYLDNFSKIGFIDKISTVYRQNANSSWFGANKINRLNREIAIRENVLKVCDKKFYEIVNKHLEIKKSQLQEIVT
jgi:glycosyltransferase involved in cell wall biosynthesis